MLKKIRPEEFRFGNTEISPDALDGIEFYYGNYPQKDAYLQINGSTYRIYHREIVKLIGSVGNPLHALLNQMNEKTIENLQSSFPDAVFYKFLGIETLVDYHQPNPEGLFVLKYELALAARVLERPVDQIHPRSFIPGFQGIKRQVSHV
ncbi:MAG: hypothetical protein ACFFD4_11175 [Candidatus Odinarchaeota archaeon]